jgi:RNA polymerase sigma-70 factor (ECF subfamily)
MSSSHNFKGFLSSQVLLQRAREKDQDAVGLLFERYRDPLRRALRRSLGSNYRDILLDSEDAVQDGILAAFADFERFEYRGEGSFLAWLLRVAERKVLMRLREKGRLKRGAGRVSRMDSLPGVNWDPVAREAGPLEEVAGLELEERIRESLEELGERERVVIVLRRFFGLSATQIREEMGLVSEGAARALLSRAQARLALLLDSSIE